ncbi:MAG: hypothetical protein QM802_14975 [Agriterribacter sp.]
MEKEVIPYLQDTLAVSLAGTWEEIRQKVYNRILWLVEHDFQKLVEVLYRVDVNEQKLKNILNSNTEKNTEVIIGDLIIERQLEKLRSRNQFRNIDDDIPEEEKW